MLTQQTSTEAPETQAPAQPSERKAWLAAATIALAGVAALAAALSGVLGTTGPAQAPPAVLVRAQTPLAGSGTAQAADEGAIVARPTAAQQSLEASRIEDGTQVHISRRWMEGFYPIYATAQSAFGVNWLLIASIHMQESAFSTAPGTYVGLNFAHCCGGPMQFNVTNGRVTTWDLVADSYVYGRRPAHYDHETKTHPSIYDDFDAIMAAAHLLSADGAGYALDDSAWTAAYDYYGHDATGVLYADQVLARAIGWSQHGFCINCGVQQPLVDAVQAAYGAPVLSALQAEEAVASRSHATAASSAGTGTARTRRG